MAEMGTYFHYSGKGVRAGIFCIDRNGHDIGRNADSISLGTDCSSFRASSSFRVQLWELCEEPVPIL